MFPTLSLGGAVIPTAPLILILGAYVVLDSAERTANQLGQNGIVYYAIAVNALIAGFVAARVAFVLQHLTAFLRQPISIIWPLTAGYNLWVGLFVGVLVLLWRTRTLGQNGWRALDVFAPTLIIAFGVMALADFLGGPGLGTPTAMPWGLQRIDVARHPVQIYEVLVSIVGLFVWWWLSRGDEGNFGRIGLITLITFSAGRLFVDAYRANTPLIADGFHLIQLTALGVVLVSIMLLARLHLAQYQ